MYQSAYALDLTMSNLEFFEPRPVFIRTMKRVAGNRLIIDCGAGVGHITKLLLDSGLRTCAIDIIRREKPECKIIPLDSSQFPFNKDMLALIARPCSGPWIRKTFEQAISRGSEVIYVGIKRNFERDLSELPYRVDLLCKKAGKENEQVFRISSHHQNRNHS